MTELTNSRMEPMASTPPPYLEAGNEVAVFTAAHLEGMPVLLKGPTGCGKTRFVEHMAARLGRDLITVACHEDLSAADLVGRHLLVGGDTTWVDGPLTTAVRNGAICYLDEVVEARQDTTVVLHPLADHRRQLPVDRLNMTLSAAAGFTLVLSYNPGYQSALKELKPSTRQRMVCIDLAFPSPQLEAQILVTETGCDADTASALAQFAASIRSLQGTSLTEAASTRALVTAARLVRQGVGQLEAAQSAVVRALTDDPLLQRQLEQLALAVLGGSAER